LLCLLCLLWAAVACAQEGELKVNLGGRVLPVFEATAARDVVLKAGRGENTPTKGKLKAGEKVVAGYPRQGWLAVFAAGAREPAEDKARGYVPMEALRLAGIGRPGPERSGKPAEKPVEKTDAATRKPAASGKKAAVSGLSAEEAAQTAYVVQAAAFPDRVSAEAVAKMLRKKGFEPELLSLDGGDQGVVTVIILGSFAEAAKARALADSYLGRTGKVARVNAMSRGELEKGLAARP
jgi:hypothetical protein